MSDQSIADRIKSNKRCLNSVPKPRHYEDNTQKTTKKSKSSQKRLKPDLKTSADNYESSVTLNELNDDVLSEILRRLPLVDRFRSQVVCKRWQQLVITLLSKQTSLGLKNIGYDRSDCLSSRHSVTDQELIDKAFFDLSVCNSTDIDTQLKNAVQWDQNRCHHNLRSITSRCPKILSLDLHRIDLDESLVQLIVTSCPKLECLQLNSMVITDKAWQRMTKRLGKRLVHLTIRNSIKSNQKSFVAEFVRSCGQLQCLKVTEWNLNLHFQWFDYMSDSVEEVHIACTSAKHIFMDEIKTRDGIRRMKLSTFEALSQSVIDSIGQSFVNLTQIDLRNCEGFNKRSYRSIAGLTELKHLSMDLPFANCDEDFALLAQNCTKMRRIDLNFGLLSLTSLQLIGQYWPQLESASFRFVSIEKLNAEALDVFIGWTHLRRLGLYGTNISDQICRVIHNCDSLRSLSLDLCNAISRKVVHSVVSRAKQTPKEAFELSIRDTKINRFGDYNVNVIAHNVIRVDNVYIYYTTEDI